MKTKQLDVSFNETRSFVSRINSYNRALLRLETNESLVQHDNQKSFIALIENCRIMIVLIN